MLKIVLSLSLLLATQVALAAIPPMNNEMREMQASHIVEGKVIKLEKVLIKTHGEDPEFKDWNFTAHVDISQFIKGETMAEMAVETITVKYWKSARRPRGWTGSQGQNSGMSEGNQVRLFMTKDTDSGTYQLLIPNGWESLGDNQSILMDAMDEGELYDSDDSDHLYSIDRDDDDMAEESEI